MIEFLFKGLIRDRQKSLFPIIIISIGVILSTILYSWMMGAFNEIIDSSAQFDTGHVKIMTQAYSELSDQVPNDLGLIGVDSLIDGLTQSYPDYDWVKRIKFGGLLDIPDSTGETKEQGMIVGFAIDILGKNSKEPERMELQSSIITGHIPDKPGEVLLGKDVMTQLNIKLNDVVTLISSSSNGSMAIQNFIVAGTVEFGIMAMDRGAMIADVSDIQYALDMYDGAGEILGFADDGFYNSEETTKIRDRFNKEYSETDDKYSPIMLTLEDQNQMREYLAYAKSMGFIIVFIFVFAMSIVLWNAGLMSGLRRYGEIGVRIALGESKGHVYMSMIYESIYIGLSGSLIGTAIGLGITYYLQQVGIDLSEFFKNSTLMVNNILRARITFTSYYIGFIPGLFATILGTAIAGIGILKRQTATLFKELE
ncbi:MAG: FtsX-like permease family protein [Ignavibacteria bacterium]|jgi:putative ABC transport system permease protein